MTLSLMVHDLLGKTFSLKEHVYLILQAIFVEKINSSSWIKVLTSKHFKMCLCQNFVVSINNFLSLGLDF